MAFSFWFSAFTAQTQRLAFPTIANIKAMAIASFTASSVAHVSISTEAFQIPKILSTPQEFQTLSLIDSRQEGGLIDNITKARRMNAIIDTTIKDITSIDINKTTHESNIVDNRKDTTQSTDAQATAPLIIADNKSAQVVEVSHQDKLIHNVDTTTNDNRNATFRIAGEELFTRLENEKHIYQHVLPETDIIEVDNSKGHTYHHVLPIIDIVEVNSSMASKITDVADVDDMGVSASSIGYDFERFLMEDKMTWVHAVANQPELCHSISKTKKQAIEVTKQSTPVIKATASDIKLLTDKKTENISSKKVVDTEVVFLHHNRRLSNDTISSTETDNTTDSNASRATTPDTPETVYSIADTNKVNNKFDDPALANINELKQAVESQSPSATLDTSSFDNMYNYSHLSHSELEVTLIMERLDLNCRYVQMSCGYWYALDDDDEIRPMSKAEYQEFIDWTSQTPVVTRDDFDKKQQADAEEGIMTSNAIAIIENDYHPSDPLAAWESTLAVWKDPEDLDEDWGVIGLFNHPDGQRQIVIGNDEQVYWMYEGMFRLLDARELDQFNRWRDGDEFAFDEMEAKREPKTWVRAVLGKRRNMNKWYAWGLEMESIEEVEEVEEVYECW
ncbi:hypothetical protein GE21DRAFT_2422 [Neurospora crassa]|uniref:Uncharacterized protein n=1 Tax=Neurospora crassa (strain ATCC 24698 / 74-OR23-1A / CBS 708.71 / DSM 1257 / FGSC 987) TaxID=367110 RepID=Q7SDC0_NEUCR|nr:hypothetical protein NCU02872 [Neurospora crassa OR74A]EAA34770.3 hypothetical protein NCU02872 [Neurospora crassa OR74A]KHE78696.1 hypothetical protein GE21DRAFT_2422 [Neurospora crassa]|eukprot:XP_964006.3 hypothetical protein NCU02872 [Neurospora crassa OR74A]